LWRVFSPPYPVADFYRGEDHRSRSYHYTVTKLWAFVEGFFSSIPRADRGAMPDQAIIADRSFPVKHDAVLVYQAQPSPKCNRERDLDAVVIADVSIEPAIDDE